MPLLITAAVVLGLATALVLVHHLIDTIKVLKSITSRLANARILLLTAQSQTEPAAKLVGGIGSNVTSLHDLVTSVARSLSIPVGGRR